MKPSVILLAFVFALSVCGKAEEFERANQFAIEASIEGVDFEKLLGYKTGKYSSGATKLPRTAVRPGKEASLGLTIPGTESKPVFNLPGKRGITLLLTPAETADGDIMFSGTLEIHALPDSQSKESKGVISLESTSVVTQTFTGSCRPSVPVEFDFYTTEGKRATLAFTIYPLDVPGNIIR